MKLLDLLQSPEGLEHIRPDDVPGLLGELTAWEVKIKMMVANANGNGAPPLRLLTAEEVADMLHVKPFYVEEQARRGKIKKVVLGRNVRFRRT
jgi:excisionase family DNA binding protein